MESEQYDEVLSEEGVEEIACMEEASLRSSQGSVDVSSRKLDKLPTVSGSEGKNLWKKLPADVRDVLEGKNIIKTVVAFLVGMSILISLQFMSLISFIGYLGLAILSCTFGYRLYLQVFGSGDEDLIKKFEERLDNISLLKTLGVDSGSAKGSTLKKHVVYAQDVFLIKDFVLSAKALALFYVMTIVGGWFNLMTLVTLTFVLLFAVPITYSFFGPQIDSLKETAMQEINKIIQLVKDKVGNLPMFEKFKTQ